MDLNEWKVRVQIEALLPDFFDPDGSPSEKLKHFGRLLIDDQTDNIGLFVERIKQQCIFDRYQIEVIN